MGGLFFGGAGDLVEVGVGEVGGVVAETHEDADAVVALLLEEGGGDGGIDSAGHGDYYFFWCGHGGVPVFGRGDYSGVGDG